MKTYRFLTLLFLTLVGTTLHAQTLNVNVGNVTYLHSAANVGDMTFGTNTAGSATLTIEGMTYTLSDVSSMEVADNSFDDNQVSVTYNGNTATVAMSGNLASKIGVSIDGANVRLVQDANATINAVSYVLSGTSSNGSFYMEGTHTAALTLNNLTLTSTNGATIDIQDGKKTNIYLQGSTTLADAANGTHNACFYVDGGGGVKPVIPAKEIRDRAIEIIRANGHDPKKAIINKASITMHYLAPDENFENMHKLPQILSPTCRIKTSDTTFSYMGLTDASDSNEDQGNIHRSQMTYSPDITYHLQRLIGLEDGDEQLAQGSYDIWMLVQHNDVVTTTTSGNSEMSDLYNYMAYQSMMSGMYGGYGGYGYGYGYGGYGNYYSNYYNYQMMAQMYGSSSTTSTSSANLDRDRYYYCKLYGPDAADPAMRPTFSFTYSIPNE